MVGPKALMHPDVEEALPGTTYNALTRRAGQPTPPSRHLPLFCVQVCAMVHKCICSLPVGAFLTRLERQVPKLGSSLSFACRIVLQTGQ